MYQLNDDCLECIFQYVPKLHQQVQVSRVCQRFRDIFAQRIWRRNEDYQTFALCNLRPYLSLNDLTYFVRANADSIRTVLFDYTDFDPFSNPDSDPDSQRFPKPRYDANCVLDPAFFALYEYLLALPQLKSLSVHYIDNRKSVRIQSQASEVFRMCAARISSISSMHVRQGYTFQLPVVWEEFSCLHKLIYFIDDYDTNFDFDIRCDLETFSRYAQYAPQLQILCLLIENLPNVVVLEFVERCPLLQHLDIRECQSLDEALLLKILILRKDHQCGAVRQQSLTIYINEFTADNLDEQFWAAQQQFITLERSRSYEEYIRYYDLEVEFE